MILKSVRVSEGGLFSVVLLSLLSSSAEMGLIEDISEGSRRYFTKKG